MGEIDGVDAFKRKTEVTHITKSGDELDALTRHLLDAGTIDTDGIRHSAKIAWRALANLQKEIEDWDSSSPQNAEEVEMLRNHRLQLTLYSMVFQKQESFKSEDVRRRIKPPALLISTSGRLVEMPLKMYEEAQTELSSLLEWIAALTANENVVREPKRLPIDSIDICKKCPFYKGELRMCGPEGTDLGINN